MLMTDLPVANRTLPELRVRRIQWSESEHTPKYWCSGEPYFTSVMNALSCLFPGGERFFIASVQKFHGQIREPQLKNNVKLFCGQESLHGQQYGKFNQWLARQGYPVEHWERRFESQLQWRAQFYGEHFCMSLTAALEHMTAVLGNAVLSTPLLQQALHEDVRPLVIWHAIEEIEQKAVAFDVFRAVNSNYILRMAGFILAIVELSLNLTVLFLAFLRHDRQT